MVSITAVPMIVAPQATTSRLVLASIPKENFIQEEIKIISRSAVESSNHDELIYDRMTISSRSQDDIGKTETNSDTNEGASSSRYEQMKGALAQAKDAYAQVQNLMASAGFDITAKSPEAIALADKSMAQQAPEFAKSIRIHQSIANQAKRLLADGGLDDETRKNIVSSLETAELRLKKSVETASRNYQVTGKINSVDHLGFYIPTDFTLSYKGKQVY